jgi:hypothetical protein
MSQPPEFPIIDIHDKNPNQYIDKARQLVLEHYNHSYLDIGEELHISEVYVVWFSKVLKNWKALVATEVANDGLYFEVTHNGDKNETYLDAYVKASNTCIPDQQGANIHTTINIKPTQRRRTGAVDANGDAVG